MFPLLFTAPYLAQNNYTKIFPEYLVEKEFISVEDGLASREIYCVAQDKNGFIWFGTKFGLNRYDGKNFKLFTTQDGLSSNIISNMFVDANNHLIIQHGNRWSPHVTTGKIDVFDVNTFKTEPYKKKIHTSKFIEKNSWIYNYLDKDLIYKIGTVSGNNYENKMIQVGPNSRIYFMPEKKEQMVFSENDGLYYIEDNVKIKLLNNSDLFEGDKGRINYFLKDALGNLWICMPQGVYKIKLKKNYFYSYFTNYQQNLYPWPQARGIYVDLDKDGQKVVYANVMASIFSFGQGLNQKIIGLGWGIIAIKNLLYYCGNYLNEVDKNTLKPIRSTKLFNSNEKYTTCVFQYSDSILYLGTSNSILAYNRLNQLTWELPKSSEKIPTVKEVYRIVRTSNGITAVAENGIYIIKNGKICDYYGPQTKDKSRYIPIQSALDIHEDKNKCLWIATNGDGLVKWDWKKKGGNQKTISYTLKDGLPSLILYRIEEDDHDNLWVSTDDGIMRFNLYSAQIKLYKSEDGLPHNEFNRTSSFKSDDGWIYFGGMNGVVGFNPSDFNLKKEKQNIPFHVVGITKYTKDAALNIPWSLNKNNPSIDWFPTDRLIKIEFALLDYQSGKKKYAYRINGVQNEWIYTYDQSISIGSIPYGSHTIEIKAQLEDGTWLTNHLMIPIDVIPPFYLQAWFICLASLILITLIIFIIWYRSKLLKVQNIKLEKLVSQRTDDLNTALGDKDVLMKELHHRVKNNLQIINGLFELQKEQLQDEKAIEALNEGQIRLASIALIHQNFYGGTNLEFILFKTFLTDLVIAVKQLFENEQRIIDCAIHCDDISIDINTAIPLGLIINEFLTNSYKYLPEEQVNKKIEIELLQYNESYELIYKDNGPGLPSSVDFENTQTLGLRLVRGLANQIGGSVSYQYLSGSVFKIRFTPKFNKHTWEK